MITSKRIKDRLENLGFHNLKNFPNFNRRVGRRYWTAIAADDQKVLVKLEKLSESSVLPSLKPFYGKLDTPKLYLSESISVYRLVVVEFILGVIVQPLSYKKIDKRFEEGLQNYIMKHFRDLIGLSRITRKLKNLDFLKENYFLEKRQKHLRDLREYNSDLVSFIEEYIGLFTSQYNLRVGEYSLQHGDFYCSNIIRGNNRRFRLVDWDKAVIAPYYFDLATFIAKTLYNAELVSNVYDQAKNYLGNDLRKRNFDLQIMLALIKEKRNIAVLDSRIKNISRIKNYGILLEITIRNNLERVKRGEAILFEDFLQNNSGWSAEL